MFPIFDMRGRVTGFGARVLDDSLPKYINSPQTPLFDKSSSLYGLDLAAAAVRQQNMAVIVEGYMDVLTTHQHGFNNVVASMGTSITEKQVNALKRLSRNMALALDADAAGEEATLRAVGYENTLDAEVKVIIMPKGKDPDAVIKEDTQNWQRLQSEAVPVIDYTFNMVTSGLDLSKVSDKTLARDKLLPIIANIKDTVRRAHYLQKLARLIKVGERNLEADLAQFTSRQARYKTKEQKPQMANRTPQPLLSSPIEKECLAWLVQYPELKIHCQGLLPEYFENSENREIFLAWQKVNDIKSLRQNLDTGIHEYLDSLVSRSLPPTNQTDRENIIADIILRLQEEFLRNREAEKGEELALAAESGGEKAELAKLQEQGVEPSAQLGEVFAQKSRRR
jgi:DNA primase